MDHCSILLVDDNPHDVELTLLALEVGSGAKVKVTTSGREALDFWSGATARRSGQT